MDKKRILRYTASMFSWFLIFMVGIGFLSSSAFAVGYLMIDHSSFLRRATNRGDTSTTLAIGPNLEGESLKWAWKLDAQAFVFLSAQSSMTFEAANAYVATSREWNPDHQFSFGRRYYTWSEADRSWQMGMWTPRFLWDPLRPELVGLNGFFHTYESELLQTTFFASPITVPERGFPVRADTSGRVVADSPFWVSPPDSVVLQGRKTSVRYSIPDPDLKKALFRPGVSFKMRLGKETGAWSSLTYGFLPIYQNDIAFDPLLDLSSANIEFQTKLYPRFNSRHMGSLEAGYRESIWSAWASVTADRPLLSSVPAAASFRTVTRPAGPAVMYAMGGALHLADQLKFSGSLLVVDERAPAPDSASQLLPTETLQSRFSYEKAYQFGATWETTSPIIIDSRMIRDEKKETSLVSMDLVYRPVRYVSPGSYTGGFNTSGTGWSLGVGADFIDSKTGSGWLGQYAGNDRVRARFSYAF